jgi:signal transduction histidine kinase/CheY-like chemotaxis protein
MNLTILNPDDPEDRQIEKLLKISAVLMRRVEKSTDEAGAAYAQFERAAMLEEEIRARTRELARALDALNEANAKLAEAHEETEAARANLVDAIETIREGFALFDDADVLVLANSRFCAHLPDVQPYLVAGLSFEEYVGRVSRSAQLDLPEGMTPDLWAEDRRARHKDEHVMFNARLAGDRFIQVSEHRTAAGGTVVLQTDVTDIMRVERQERDRMLDDQARVVRATLEHITQGVAIFDAAGRLAGANSRLGELLAIPVTRLTLATPFVAVFEGFLGGEGGLLRLSEWMATRRLGPLSFETRHGGKVLQIVARAMPDSGSVVSFTDITAERNALAVISEANEFLEQRVLERTLELEAAVAAAERANATKSRFVAAASHDLLQPLSAAKLYLSALEAEAPGERLRGVVTKAQSALASVETILDALLDISKLDSGASLLDVADVPLATVMRQLRDEFAPLAARKGLDLRIIPSSAVVRSDPTYFRRILQNLIGNAVKYTARGRVLVGARRAGGAIRIEVRDTGPGIPSEHRRRIFQEFARLDETASASEGMGLGLAIVERASALLRHPIGLVSEVGRGSVFSVTVPLSTAAPAATLATPAALPSLEGRILLLVDTEGELRRALAALLESWGLDVLEAESAEAAIALVDEIGVAPDIVLVSARLGAGLSGTRTVEALRSAFGRIPAALVSADRSRTLSDTCLQAGIVLVGKPIDPETLRRDIVALAAAAGVPA